MVVNKGERLCQQEVNRRQQSPGPVAAASVPLEAFRGHEELEAAAAMWQARAAHLEDRLLALGAGQVNNVDTPVPPAEVSPEPDSPMPWWVSLAFWRRPR